MAALFAGMERTIGHWEALLRSEGLRLSTVWGPARTRDGGLDRGSLSMMIAHSQPGPLWQDVISALVAIIDSDARGA